MGSWYYELNGSQQGPVGESTLRDLISEGMVQRETLIWQEGMADWERADSVRGLFSGPPPVQSRTRRPPPRSYEAEFEPRYAARSYRVESHMVKAVLSTLFCCLPLGVVAIIQASKVNGAVAVGDYDEAERLSQSANTWGNISIILGAIGGALYFLAVLGGLAA